MNLRVRPALCAVLLGLCAAAASAVPARVRGSSEAPRGSALAELEDDLDKGLYDRAIRAGEAALAADPSNSVASDLLGRAYGLKAKDSQVFVQAHLARKARAAFEKAVALDPANISARADLATYDMRAPVLLGGGKEKARRQIEEIRKLDAARAHELSGDLAVIEKDSVRAEEEYRLAVEASPPGQDRARRALSDFLVVQARYGPARQIWQEALEEDPSDVVARYELAGIAIASRAGLAPAAADLEAALASGRITSDPSRAEVYAPARGRGAGPRPNRPCAQRARGGAPARAVSDRVAPVARPHRVSVTER